VVAVIPVAPESVWWTQRNIWIFDGVQFYKRDI